MESLLPARSDDDIADNAAEWLVRLHAQHGASRLQHDLQAWLNLDPRHARIWQEMTGHLEPAIASIRDVDRRAGGRATAACRALAHDLPQSRRRLLRGTLGLGALAAAAALIGHQALPLDGLTASVCTGTGEIGTRQLADGSMLTLAPRSIVDLDTDGGITHVHLRRGALVVDTAGGSPVTVSASSGDVSAAGRLLIEQRTEGLRVATFRTAAQLSPAGGAVASIEAGTAAMIADGRVRRLAADPDRLAAWTTGMLDLRDGTLGDVVDALQNWHMGGMRVSARAANIPVFGVFRLDDVERTLDQLAEVLPIQVNRIGNLLISIDMR